MDINIGHNEETFDYFTRQAKRHKRQVEIQDQLIASLGIDIKTVSVEQLHDIIKQAQAQALQEFGV
jgi:hypothetical protein